MTEIGEGLQSLGGYNKIKIKKKGVLCAVKITSDI